MCLNEFKMNILRQCDNNSWIRKQASHCHYIQATFETSELCPHNYKTINNHTDAHLLCVLLTKPKIWKNQCNHDGSINVILSSESE